MEVVRNTIIKTETTTKKTYNLNEADGCSK